MAHQLQALIFFCGSFSLAACGSGGSSAAPTPPIPAPTPTTPITQSAIKHVVIVLQENRTPDNIFRGYPGMDTSQTGIDSHGKTVRLTPVNLATNYDLGHSHAAFTVQYDGGKMDGNDLVGVNCKEPAGCGAEPGFRYVPQAQVQPYWTMAQQYASGDRMFQTNEGPSYPAHQYIIAGNSAIAPSSNFYAAENVANSAALPEAGCAASAGNLVTEINIVTGDQSQKTFPCFEHPTLLDLLDARGISWKYYAPSANSIWTARIQ